MNPIDPVTLVVVQNGLQQVASEMDLTFERAAFSPVISEGFDGSDGIYDKDAGDVIAQGELGLPRAMPPTVPSDAIGRHRHQSASLGRLALGDGDRSRPLMFDGSGQVVGKSPDPTTAGNCYSTTAGTSSRSV